MGFIAATIMAAGCAGAGDVNPLPTAATLADGATSDADSGSGPVTGPTSSLSTITSEGTSSGPTDATVDTGGDSGASSDATTTGIAQEEVCDRVDNDFDGLVDEFSDANERCEPCSLYQRDTFAYWVCDDEVTWAVARDTCLDYGADLASIADQGENDFLSAMVIGMNDGLWLGASDVALEDDWIWTDGSAWTFTDWGTDEPNNFNGSEHWLEISVVAEGWNDRNATYTTRYACKAGHSP